MINLFLDSGAFTAWRGGTPIDIDEYAEFCLEYGHLCELIASLDVIPGTKLGRPSTREVELAAKASYENWRLLQGAGVKAVPVYHKGERRYWLERYLDESEGVVALGGTVGMSSKARHVWNDDVFDYLCGDNPYPAVRIHGFGVNAIGLLFEYPWSSADSNAWAVAGGFGECWFPQFDRNGPNLTTWPHQISISKAEHRKTGTRSVWEAGPYEKEQITRYVEQMGFTMEGLAHSREQRLKYNVAALKVILTGIHPRPFKGDGVRVHGFFRGSHRDGVSESVVKKLRVYFATGADTQSNRTLTEAGVSDRLISYWMIQQKRVWDMERYVETGLVEPQRNKRRVRPR